jgi:hypothetical protein
MSEKNGQSPELSDTALERVMQDVLGLWPLSEELGLDDLLAETSELMSDPDQS